MTWNNLMAIAPRVFDCGYCDRHVASDRGFFRTLPVGKVDQIYICPNCQCPSYFAHEGLQVPSIRPGENVQALPEHVEALYNEARSCCSVGAFTASVLATRKLLMNIAVSKDAKEGLTFVEYIDFLEESHYTPPQSREWVDHIRSKGNEATHEIKVMSREDATELIGFAGMLLKFIYEFPSKVPKKAGS